MDLALLLHDVGGLGIRGPGRFAPRQPDEDGDEREAELAVIGMGKLGGEELNFASDIDVIYVYTTDQGAAGDISLHEFMSKLCERVSASLGEPSEEDLVFRVDLRLRPAAEVSPLALSFNAALSHYESSALAWERAAFIRARAAAGDIALGQRFLQLPIAEVEHIELAKLRRAA
jgi:glutamate-ammonia-ligase adenylyltransferase